MSRSIFLLVSLNLCAMTTATISPKVAAQAESVSLQDIVTRNMKVAMTLRNVKQKDLANALGVDRSSISQKMTRRVAWSLEDIEKASDFFHVKPEALVAGHGFEPWTSSSWPNCSAMSLWRPQSITWPCPMAVYGRQRRPSDLTFRPRGVPRAVLSWCEPTSSRRCPSSSTRWRCRLSMRGSRAA